MLGPVGTSLRICSSYPLVLSFDTHQTLFHHARLLTETLYPIIPRDSCYSTRSIPQYESSPRTPTKARFLSYSYLGKSTGEGAPSIWAHHLKDIGFLNYTSAHYTGQAVRMTASVQGVDIYEAAMHEGWSLWAENVSL